MRGDDDLRVVEQGVVCGWRFFGEDIRGITGEFARVQGGNDRVLIDQFATARVDDPSAVGKPVQTLGVDAVKRVSVEIRVWADDVHRVKNRVK